MKITKIVLLSVAFALTCACKREQEPQYIAGFISKIESEQFITIDSMGSGIIKRFTIDENTQRQTSALVEGNVAEIMYIPTEEEQTPIAISVTTDDTYPKVLGRWTTPEGDKTPIDIELLTRGRIHQHLPEGVLEYTAWQLMAKEDTIRLIGRLSLPPIVEKEKKKEKTEKGKEEIQPAPRREQAFTTIAVVGTESDRRTLTIINNKGQKSTLYKKE